MGQKNLILLGGGGHCKSVIDVAESAGYNILGVLDKAENVGNSIFGYNIIGTDDDIPQYVNTAEFIITVGFIKNPATRIKIYNKVKEAGGKLATIVSPTAYVSKHSTLGEGTIIMHQAIVNVEAKIGINCIINTMADVDHGVIIGDFSHLSAGTLIAGEAKIGDRCFCGIGSTIQHLITITSDVILGAATLVVKDITESGIYVGAPARFLKKV